MYGAAADINDNKEKKAAPNNPYLLRHESVNSLYGANGTQITDYYETDNMDIYEPHYETLEAREDIQMVDLKDTSDDDFSNIYEN